MRRSRGGNPRSCPRPTSVLILGALVALVTMTVASCSADVQPTPTPTSLPAADLRVALASTDIAVGSNRIAFGLIDPAAGAIRDASVDVSTFFLAKAGVQTPEQTVGAEYRRWPVGDAGVYTIEVVFDQPGHWGLGIRAEVDGIHRKGTVALEVAETSSAPAVGSPAPRSVSKTSADGVGLEELTTDPNPAPALYEMTIAEAADSGRPSLVVFATPAYCTTSTCGPQLRVVKQLMGEYPQGVNFIHVEVWDNPHEIDGDLSRGRLSPTLAEWGLVTEPWTFILDHEGLVSARFEGFVTAEELMEALDAVAP